MCIRDSSASLLFVKLYAGRKEVFPLFFQTPFLAHRSDTQQCSQSGFVLALQTALPWNTRRWQKSLPSFGGISFQRAISTFLGSFMPSTNPIRFTRRMQWVSVTMAGFPNTSPMIRLALLRPTPGSFNRSSKVSGTCPPYCSFKIRIQALISLALLRPRPQGLDVYKRQDMRRPLGLSRPEQYQIRSCSPLRPPYSYGRQLLHRRQGRKQ